MSHEIALLIEMDYRRQRLLAEAEAERIAKEVRKAASARSR